MNIQIVKHENVKEDGTFKDKAGAINTERGISYGEPCSCGCSPENWLIFNKGLEDGVVELVSITGPADEVEAARRIITEAL